MASIKPAEKRARKAVAKAQEEDTFQSIGDDWYNSKFAHRSNAWREANKLYLNRDLYPKIGELCIRDIEPKRFLDALEKCKKERGVKTADRIRQTAAQVFEHAILKSKTQVNPAALLKRWAKIPRAVNRPHLVENEIHELIDAIDAYSGEFITKLAAKLLLLTFTRKTELLEATWDEFYLPNAKWIIPAERMKMKDVHIVPLSKQSLETLEMLRPLSCGSLYVFPKYSTILKPMSRTTLNSMFSTMADGKYKGEFSPHGIRATASTWLNERGYRHDVIERQLAHSERNLIRASYNHADYLPERRVMMQVWADFLFPFTATDGL